MLPVQYQPDYILCLNPLLPYAHKKLYTYLTSVYCLNVLIFSVHCLLLQRKKKASAFRLSYNTHIILSYPCERCRFATAIRLITSVFLLFFLQTFVIFSTATPFIVFIVGTLKIISLSE